MIFLFKYKSEQEADQRATIDSADVPGIFFAKQVVNNACATQAILSVLFNNSKVELGNELKELKDFCVELDVETRGMVIGQSDHVRVAHNSFAKPEPFLNEESKYSAAQSGDTFHFISYVPFAGKVYEIDGLKAGPIDLGDVPSDSDWLSVARPAIETRMGKYAVSETHFTLLSVQPRPSIILEKEMLMLQGILNSVSLVNILILFVVAVIAI